MFDLKVEKIISREASDVFKALQEGKLFMNCSADSNTIEVDFRVGGKYKLEFKNHKVSNWGEFLEIIPNKKVVFSWCQGFGVDQTPDTRVTIELFPEGKKTKLVLEHKGFKDQATLDDHTQGWNGGISDLTGELENGRIRFNRRFDTTVEQLFQNVLSVKEIFTSAPDVVLNQKIAITPNVTLLFNKKDDGTSAMELIHENISTDKEQSQERKKWDAFNVKLMEMAN